MKDKAVHGLGVCRKDLEGSHVPKCPFELVPCTNKKTSNGATIRLECGALVQRSDLQKHMTTECQMKKSDMCISVARLKGAH